MFDFSEVQKLLSVFIKKYLRSWLINQAKSNASNQQNYENYESYQNCDHHEFLRLPQLFNFSRKLILKIIITRLSLFFWPILIFFRYHIYFYPKISLQEDIFLVNQITKLIIKRQLQVFQIFKFMENDSQQRQCDNCNKMFPSDKIDLHQAYCFRNIKKCPKCQKMIDINEQQAHDVQEHTNKQCELCQAQFSPAVFENHPETCPRKPVDCEFCQNTYALCQIQKHKEACGSRTQVCTVCQKPVMIRQIKEHTEKCQKRAEERRVEVSQDVVRNHHRNQNEAPSRQRQNSQNVRDRRKSSASKNIITKPAKIKPSHMIGPESIKPMIDPVPISIRMAMKGKQQVRPPLKSKN